MGWAYHDLVPSQTPLFLLHNVLTLYIQIHLPQQSNSRTCHRRCLLICLLFHLTCLLYSRSLVEVVFLAKTPMRLSRLHYRSYNTSSFCMMVTRILFVCLMTITMLLTTPYLKRRLRSFSVLHPIRTTPPRCRCSPRAIERYGARHISSSSRHRRMPQHCSSLQRASLSFASTVKDEKAHNKSPVVPTLMLMLLVVLVLVLIVVTLETIVILAITKTWQVFYAIRHK